MHRTEMAKVHDLIVSVKLVSKSPLVFWAVASIKGHLLGMDNLE